MVEVAASLDVACKWARLADGTAGSMASKVVCGDINLLGASNHASKAIVTFSELGN